MTTIVYDHKNKQIAIDSREVAGDEIKSDKAIKWKVVDGTTYFMSGCVSDYPAFFALDKVRGVKPDVDIHCSSIFIRKGAAFKCAFSDTGYWELELSSNDSIGSGGVYAISALDFGKSAREAVDYAKTRDVNTGGKTVVFSLDKNKFIK